MSMSASTGDMKITGLAATLGVALGGAVSEDHIVAFHIWDTLIGNPSTSGSGLSSNLDGRFDLFSLGIEYTAYSKQNFYISISPSLTRARVEGNGSSSDTKWGFGARVGVGKEWWASDHWGLGAVAHVSASFNEDSGSNGPTWTTWATTIAFTATYN
jgi:hypothetical protein